MFYSRAPAGKTGLEEEIDRVLAQMKTQAAEDTEYAAMVKQLNRLYKLKDLDRPQRVSPDTLAIIAGNLTVALLIVKYERLEIVTSKVQSFLLKLR